MTEIYLHFLFAHYGLYENAPVLPLLPNHALAAVSSHHNSVVSDIYLLTPECNKLLSGSLRGFALFRNVRVRVQLIGHARNNMQVNLSHAWL